MIMASYVLACCCEPIVHIKKELNKDLESYIIMYLHITQIWLQTN